MVHLAPLAKRPGDLNGKRVFLVAPRQNGSRVEESFEKVEKALKDHYPQATVIHKYKDSPYSQDDPAFWDELVREADAFVYGAAPSASSTDWAINWSGLLEKRGLAGVVIAYQSLVPRIRNSIANKGVPVRYVPVSYPPKDMDGKSTKEAMDRVMAALTSPLTEKEKLIGDIEPQQEEKYSSHGSVDDAIEYFHAQGWTDGLPIVPPTQDRVTAMLKGTSHASDEVVSKSMWPEKWTATVEKVAINAVMAGATPEYLPVLLALAEGWGKSPSYSTVQSTNSFAYMAVVNGPIRKEIDMNAGTYALGPGNRANATIGRALRLFITNLGGGKPGVNMMGSQGNPAMYSFAFAEHEEASPWESLAVEYGHKRGENTVSLFFGGWSKVGNYLNGDLDRLIKGIAYYELPGRLVVLMTPLAAKMQAKKGLSKEALKKYIMKNATMSLGEFKKDTYYDWFVLPSLLGKNSTPGMQWPKEYLTLPDTAMVSLFPTHKNINLIVVGGDVNPMMQGWSFAGPFISSIDKWK